MISLLLIERTKLRDAAQQARVLAAATDDDIQNARLADYAAALECRANRLSDVADMALDDWYAAHPSCDLRMKAA